MNNDIARLVIRIATDIGLEVRSYSGRGMYGARCIGVTVGNPFQDFAKLMVGLCEIGDEGLDAAEHLTRCDAVQTDSMGCGSIVYFPRLPWVEECDECGDYDCEKASCRASETVAST